MKNILNMYYFFILLLNIGHDEVITSFNLIFVNNSAINYLINGTTYTPYHVPCNNFTYVLLVGYLYVIKDATKIL